MNDLHNLIDVLQRFLPKFISWNSGVLFWGLVIGALILAIYLLRHKPLVRAIWNFIKRLWDG